MSPNKQFMDFHTDGQAALWCIVGDIAILFALYSYRKYSFYIHAFLGCIVISMSLAYTLPIILPNGLYLRNSRRKQLVAHLWFAVTFLILVCLLLIFGVLSRILQSTQTIKSKTIYIVKKIHGFIGYSVYIVTRVTILLGYYSKNPTPIQFKLILAWETVMIIVFITRKLYFPKLQSSVVDPQTLNMAIVPQIYPNQLNSKIMNYILFSNYVYNIDALKVLHPAGYQVVRMVSGRQIDRFLYGMYYAQLVPELKAHSHSFKSLQLIGGPVAKISIPSTYETNSELFDVCIKQKKLMSQENEIYYLQLAPKFVQSKVIFKGYSDVRQLGRYYSLTINDKTTRLYTSVSFLQRKNINFLSKIFVNLNYIGYRRLVINDTNHQTQHRIIQLAQQMNQETPVIPLMIKKYSKGKLTSQLFTQNNPKLKLSCLKGLGLHFSTLKPGRIIIVAGGTGIFPFLDLFDLLYKQKLINQSHVLSERILQENPILVNNPFEKFNFVVMAAFKNHKDLHPISLQQLEELSNEQQKFKTYLRISEEEKIKSQIIFKKSHSNIVLTKQRFETILEKSIEQKYSKIWICGPPEMSTSLAKILYQKGLTSDQYLLL